MIPPDIRAIVDARDGGRCQRCGDYVRNNIGFSRHHRKARGLGGSKLFDTVPNIVTLCGFGNASGCHGAVHANPAESYAAGWLVRRNSTDDPATIPIPSYRGLVLLTADGGAEPYEAPRHNHVRILYAGSVAACDCPIGRDHEGSGYGP